MESRYPARTLDHQFVFVTVITLLASVAPPVSGQESAAPPTPEPAAGVIDLTLTGSDEILWMSRGWQDESEKTLLNAFAYQRKGSPKTQALVIAPQIGEILHTAVVGEGLHVFLATRPEGRDRVVLHQRYTPQEGPRRELRLPGFEVPVAIAGGIHEKRPMMWAIVTRATRAKVAAEWQARQSDSETQPADTSSDAEASPEGEAATEEPAPVPEADQGWGFVRYDGNTWRPGVLLPDECRGAESFLLCRSQEGVIDLFWKDQQDERRLHHYHHADETWSRNPSIKLQVEPHAMLAAVMNRQLVLASLVPTLEPDRFRCQTRILHRGLPPDDSSDPQWLMMDETKPLIVGREARMAAFADNLAIVFLKNKDLQLGIWSPSTRKPVKSVETVVIPSYSVQSPSERGLKDFAVTLIVAALVLLLFWRRQESISQPVPLPPGVLIAGVGKRFLAALLDMVPALAISLLLWIGEIRPYFEILFESARMNNPVDPNVIAKPASVLWWWVTFRVIYVLHCTLFEAITATTPGKRLLGCRVTTEDVERANIVQIIIRNVTRYLELEPGISLFLLVIFFTRNRQRIGDLLAKTIVIDGRYIPMAGPIDMDDSFAGESPEERHENASDTKDSDQTPSDS